MNIRSTAIYQLTRSNPMTPNPPPRLIVNHEAPDDAGSEEITLDLADQKHRLRFVDTHFFD